MSKSVLPMFSSRSFIVAGLTFRSLIHFEFIFVCGVKIWNASRICVSSLCRGHANLLCIIPILVYVLPKQALYPFLNQVVCFY